MMETFLAMLLVVAIYISIPVLIGLTIVGFIIPLKQSNFQPYGLTCTHDTECPPGYICLVGQFVFNQAS
jgi:hypothetical protein